MYIKVSSDHQRRRYFRTSAFSVDTSLLASPPPAIDSAGWPGVESSLTSLTAAPTDAPGSRKSICMHTHTRLAAVSA
jgi:hypothetical protein